MNRREDIRKYVVQLLSDQKIAEGNIFSTRLRPVTSDELPIVFVSIEREINETISNATSACEKKAQMAIEIITTPNEAEEYLDKITFEIETALANDLSMGSLVNKTELKETLLTVVREGDTPAGIGRMVYEVSYSASLIENKVAELRNINCGF